MDISILEWGGVLGLGGAGCERVKVSVSAILFLSYKIRADVLSSALIPLIR